MFRKKLKIKQITSCGEGGYVFVYGLGNDGRIYSWNTATQDWQLNELPKQEAADATV